LAKLRKEFQGRTEREANAIFDAWYRPDRVKILKQETKQVPISPQLKGRAGPLHHSHQHVIVVEYEMIRG
jgi:hypothetical protein